MKLRWAFLTIWGIAAAVSAMAVSCGPQKPFCPYGPDPEYICVPDSGGGLGGGGGSGPIGPCDGASPMIIDGATVCPT